MASHKEIAVRIIGALRIDTLHAVSINILFLYLHRYMSECISSAAHCPALIDPLLMTAL